MNLTKIEWTDFTWNPITGCLHGCHFCYARRMAETRLRGRCGYPIDEPFSPTFHEYRLREPSQKRNPAKIFVCSMGDLMGAWVPAQWIQQVLSVIANNPQHTFQLLTKNPQRYLEFDYPDNVWCGASLESQNELYRLEVLKQVKAEVRFVSIEPLLSDIQADFDGIEWVIIGAMTGPKAIKPRIEWIDTILAQSNGIPVFLKDNLNYPKDGELSLPWRQEFPK